ncbi:MAG: isoleucine--tRNA ligase, partial [Candidatus Eiseniibacteriota bacterium]
MSVKADRFVETSTKLDFPASEAKILDFWKETRAFEEGLKRREGAPPFIFYEGPPTANGLPGVHHVISRTVKDIVCRYQSMRGRYVPRKGGWDTHGLPVEIEVEKQLKINGKDQIETYGIAEFNALCRKSVLKYEGEWRRNTERIGFWLDMDHPYFTFANEYIETVWWLLKRIRDRGLLYQGHKIVPYCPRCGTPLSSHEVSQGYEDVTEPSVTVKFALVDEPGAFVLAWTTTPWTLPGNVALAVGADLDYVLVRQSVGDRDERYYLARARLAQLEGEYEIEKEMKGRGLVGKRYRPLFDFMDLGGKTGKNAYYVTEADFVTTEDGTGIVHTAVMYGEDDYQLGQRIDLPQYHTVDPQGRFTAEVTPWAGMNVKEAEAKIRKYLREKGSLYKEEMTTHAYPFCWRCDTPLLYYAWKTWYIATTKIREDLLAAHASVEWHPGDIGSNRFGNWLENNVDWALSRNRYWGTPLNIWRCEGCGEDRCVGSVAELREGTGVPEPLDLHRPYVDQVTFRCPKCGGTQRRVPEVIDVWFDSGAMPYAQW